MSGIYLLTWYMLSVLHVVTCLLDASELGTKQGLLITVKGLFQGQSPVSSVMVGVR